MWKKILVVCLGLVGVFSIAYLYTNDTIFGVLKANTTIYNAGGEVTGRVNKNPPGTLINESGMKKGDKILSGVKNPAYNENITWQLVRKDNYSDYGCSTFDTICSGDELVAWYSFSTLEVANTYMGLTKSDFSKPNYTLPNLDVRDTFGAYEKSNVYLNVISPLNKSFVGTDQDIIAYRNLTYYHESFFKDNITNERVPDVIKSNVIFLFNGKDELGKTIFLPDAITWGGMMMGDLEKKDVAFTKDYWTSTLMNDDGSSQYTSWTIAPDGTGPNRIWQYNNNSAITPSTLYAVRPAVYLNMENVIFGISNGSSNSIAKITTPSLPASYTALYSDAAGDAMKLRIEDSSLTSTTKLYEIENDKGIAIKRAKPNSTIYLKADALPNVSDKNVNTVSILVFDKDNNFKFYLPLAPANGLDSYEFNTTGLSEGSYKIGIVNEQYNENVLSPAYSSAITSLLDLEITQIEDLSLNVIPRDDLEYSLNTTQDSIIAIISSTGGVDPITYTIVSDTSVQGHSNDYEKFDISTDASGKPIVIVKDMNGLNAGDYYFKVNAIDSNGDPSGGVDSSTVHIIVNPTSTSIIFQDAKTTKKSVTAAATSWNETAISTPSNSELKVSYSITGGDVGLIDIDTGTGKITYKGSNSFGKITIRATVDDAAGSDKDNYISSYTEKDIIIYREVDGSITPDSASTDSTIPTFSASDINIKIGGTIGTITGSKGTPDTVDGSKTTYTYDLKKVDDHSLFHVDPITGVITAKANLGVDSYSITVIVADKWSTKEIPVTINVGVAQAEALKFYENSSSNTIITTKSVSLTDTGVTVFAVVKDSTNTNPVTYRIKDNSTNVITVNQTNGIVTIKGVGTVMIVAEKDGASGQAKAIAELQFTVNEGSQNFIYTDQAGNELSKSGDKYRAYEDTYDVNKTFQLYTSGSPNGATITYALKDPDPTLQDVISVNPSTGEVTILNASLPAQIGKIIVVATSHDLTGNYTDASIELPITINKGTRTVTFADDPINVTSGTGSVTPVVKVDEVIDTSTTYSVEVDHSEDSSIAWASNRTTIDYDYSDSTGKDIKINVTKNPDRNYVVANGTGILHIMGANESALTTTSPGKVVYGKKFSIESTQDDSLSTNVQYTFTVNDTTYISNPTVTGNKAEFDALKFSGNTETEIIVTRTADGEIPLTKKIKVKVLPKDITIQVDDQAKLRGEQNPPLSYQDFSSQLVSWNGVQDIIQANDVKLSTTAKETSGAGGYPITGDQTYLNKTYPNYSFTFTNGTLTITDENIEDHWYHLELDDGKNTAYTGKWTNENVNIISDHTDYKHISKDQSTWETPQVTVSTEGKTEQRFWLKKDSRAITSEKKETILIDKTAPNIKSITASDTNNKLQNIINQLSGGIFFKPGTQFEITTSDEKDELETSGTASIDYKIYKQNEDKSYGSPMKQDTLTVSNEKAKITIADTVGGQKSMTGTYKICVLPKDNAGNVPEKETCKELTLKKINVDVDGDGKDDFNDPDGDGCADFNIIYNEGSPEDIDEADGKQKILNVDANRDGIPEMNIDSDGDGKPDINVDTDNDGKPDLNLLIIAKDYWKPTTCVTQHGEQYASGVDLTPVINVDMTGNGIPDINIDNNGDFKPDLNISIDGKTPYTNIYTFHEWKPRHDYTSGAFAYDSIGTDADEPKRELNIDTDGDGFPDVNIDLNNDGKADINIDLNGDEIPDIDVDTTGDGKADTNIDTNGDGKPDENIVEIKEWEPEHDCESNGMKYDTMRDLGKKDQLEDQGIVVVKPDGDVFDPSYALEVENITDTIGNVTINDIKKYAGGQEIKQIYEVSLLKNSIRVQPNGSLKIKIPYDATIKSPKLIVEQSDGTYKLIEPDIEEGYLVYESNYLGKVAVIGDGETSITPKDPTTDIGGGDDDQGTSVKGSYTSVGNSVGGASTSDTSSFILFMVLGILSMMVLIFMIRKQDKAVKKQ